MAYKDKDRQRKAVREAVRRHRAKQCNTQENVIPCNTQDVIPKPKQQSYNPMMVGYVPKDR